MNAPILVPVPQHSAALYYVLARSISSGGKWDVRLQTSSIVDASRMHSHLSKRCFVLGVMTVHVVTLSTTEK